MDFPLTRLKIAKNTLVQAIISLHQRLKISVPQARWEKTWLFWYQAVGPRS